MLRLDINLVFTIINLLVLYFLMKKFLFQPVNNIIAQREVAIKQQFDDADEAQKKADDLKKQYEDSLANAKEDSAKLVQEAREKARVEYDRIVKSADEEVTKRMQKAEELLLHTNLGIMEIAWKSGYEDVYYFNRVFREKFQCSPAEYRKREKEQE